MIDVSSHLGGNNQVFDYSTVPKKLRQLGRFCLWKLEGRGCRGKPTKIPYKLDGSRADFTKLSDFTDFEGAVSAYDSGGYAGIGIGCFGPIKLIDIDRCVVDGKLDERGEYIVSKLDTYTELSPSGTGIHCYCLAAELKYNPEDYYINNSKTHVEMYNPDVTNKYLTMTGICIHGDNLEERSAELLEIMDKYLKRENTIPSKPKVKAPGSFLSDETVLSKILKSKQADVFNSLWNGVIPEGKSHSDADMSIALIFAFWCGGDIEQMDRLFRRSGLMRDKWDRSLGKTTYGMYTLQKAVNACEDFYKPIMVSATEDFNDILPRLVEMDFYRNPRYGSGDIGFGRLFADVFKKIARYVPERKKWFVYDGKRWVPDIANLSIMELGKDLADAILLYASTIHDEKSRLNYLKETKCWQQRRFRETFIKEAQSVYPLSIESFDSNIYLFNCNNVTLNLKDGTVKEHAPEDLLTKINFVDYDPEAYSDRFIKFIDEVMSGDCEKAAFLQKSLGYGISGDTRFECMFFLYGETTRNGKGTLMESILKVLGDYGKSVRPETIAQKQNVNSQAPSEDIARLAGIRFANISEPSRGLVLNAAQVKNMTGNDTLNARFLNENSFDFKPQFKLYINTNYLPVISDMTMFSSGRVIIVPFDKHFEPWEQDKTLKEEFSKPEIRSAILNWLVEGYRLLLEEGFKLPTSVENAIEAYAHESDKLAQFAEERLQEDPTAEVKSASVYEEYRRWCSSNGCYCENNRNFLHELRKLGRVERRRPQDGGDKTTLLIGFSLKDEEDFMS